MSEPFQPTPVDLPDIPTADISWDVRSLADEQGWTWDEDLGRYLDSNGQPVTEQEILDVVTAELESWEAETDALTTLLIDGEYDVRDWEQALAEIVAGVAAIFFLFGLGDRDKLTDDLAQEVTDRVQTQYEYLRGFSEAILAGTLTAAMIGARSKQYVHDAESNHGYGQDAAHDVERFPFYSNVLGSMQPCVECPELTARGIVPRGTLPAIGTRECGPGCKCHFAYYTEAEARQRESLQHFGWLGHNKLTAAIAIPLTP